MIPRTPRPTLFPYTTLFRSRRAGALDQLPEGGQPGLLWRGRRGRDLHRDGVGEDLPDRSRLIARRAGQGAGQDRKSTRLNSSHLGISYAVFCLKKKKDNNDGYILDKLEPIPSALPTFQKLFQVSATASTIPCKISNTTEAAQVTRLQLHGAETQ